MKRYYTRACNFYYGKESKALLSKKKTLPLNGLQKISFNQIEIITRKSKKKIFIKDLKKLSKKLQKQIIFDLNKITLKILNDIFVSLFSTWSALSLRLDIIYLPSSFVWHENIFLIFIIAINFGIANNVI